MQLYVTPDFLIGAGIWVAIIAFVIGFFVAVFLFKSK